MDDFLDTLPRYVHNYLNKYPINVLSLLRELVCFAVLMSNDRDTIALLTEQLQLERDLEQKNNRGVPELIKTVEITHLDEYSFYQNEEEEEKKEKKVVEQQQQQQQSLKQSNNNTIENHMIIERPNSSMSLWIPWKEDDSPAKKSTKNQVINPEMSSYHEISSDHSATNNNNNNSSALDFFWKRKSQNSKSPVLVSSHSNTTHSQRSSDSPTLLSPISPLSLKPISVTSTSSSSKRKKRRASLPPPSSMLQLNKSKSETTSISSMGHFTLQRPGSTFTVQARIEHARQRQEELERRKTMVNIPLETPISKRLKQRVSSGVDWKTIKIQGKMALANSQNQT